jgi:hypothetical protein
MPRAVLSTSSTNYQTGKFRVWHNNDPHVPFDTVTRKAADSLRRSHSLMTEFNEGKLIGGKPIQAFMNLITGCRSTKYLGPTPGPARPGSIGGG